LGDESFGGFAKLYRTSGEHIFDSTDGWHSTDYTNGAIVHGHRRFGFGNLAQAGVEVGMLSGTWIQSETSRPTWTRNQVAVFAQDEQTIGRFTVNAGARLSYDEISGPAFCPKVGAVGSIGATTLRANVNEGIRYAPLNYTSVLPPRNESLNPEVSWNYEVGVNRPLAAGLSVDVAAFMLRGEDLIEAVAVPERVPPLQFQNTGSFSFKGIEAGIELRRGRWRSTLAYTLTDFGAKTRARAGAKLNLTTGATLAKLDLDLSFQHVARYFAADSSESAIPVYYTLDLRAGYGVLSWLGVFASVENLLDRQYDTFVDLPGTQAGLYAMPGRSLTVGLELERP
jgi:outer membrane receptor protein involved in Fe transport